MNDTMMQEILKRLDVLGEKMGQGAAFTWQALMRQELWVNGVWGIFSCLLLAGLAYGLYRLSVFLWQKGDALEKKDQYSDMGPLTRGASVIVGGAAFVFGVVFPFAIDSAISHILNPQYYALMDLAKMLTGK